MEITAEQLADLLNGVTPFSKSELLSKLNADGELEFSKVKETLKPAFDSFVTNLQDDNLKKGKRERMSEFEENIRTNYGIKSKAQGEKLIAELLAEKQNEQVENFKKDNPPDNNPDNWTDAQLKSFIEESEHHKKVVNLLNEDNTKVLKEFTDYKNTTEEKGIRSVVSKFALKLLEGSKPKLEENENVAATRKKDFINEVLSSGKFRINSDDSIDLLDDNGNVMKDDRSRPIKPDTLVKDIMNKRFTFHAADPSKDTPPKPPEGGDPNAGVNLNKTTADLQKMGIEASSNWVQSLKTKAERDAGLALFKEAKLE